MRIAQVSPLHESVPPSLYGGTERVVSFLTEELVALGHDVTLFASGDSRTSGTLVPIGARALRLDPQIHDTTAPHMVLLEAVRQRADDFDIIHFHMDYWPFSVFSRQRTPFVSTLHGRLDLPEIHPIFARFPDVALVSVSDHQRAGLPGANYVRTVQHGLPSGLLMPQDNGVTPSYLAFLGRIAPEKGPDRAIRIARAAGMKLKMAAKVSDADRPYFDAVIAPMLADGGAEFIGEISDAEKPAFLSAAAGLLMPIDWPEPFGLVMIEAMACGTPVIAFDCGSVPEIVEDGLTGFIVESETQAVAAAHRLVDLCRVRIRERFEQRFTARRMAEEYVEIYAGLISAHAARPARNATLVLPRHAAKHVATRASQVAAVGTSARRDRRDISGAIPGLQANSLQFDG